MKYNLNIAKNEIPYQSLDYSKKKPSVGNQKKTSNQQRRKYLSGIIKKI